MFHGRVSIRRRELLVSRWRELAKIVGAFTVAAASLAFTVRSIPSRQAAVIGAFVGAIIVVLVAALRSATATTGDHAWLHLATL